MLFQSKPSTSTTSAKMPSSSRRFSVLLATAFVSISVLSRTSALISPRISLSRSPRSSLAVSASDRRRGSRNTSFDDDWGNPPRRNQQNRRGGNSPNRNGRGNRPNNRLNRSKGRNQNDLSDPYNRNQFLQQFDDDDDEFDEFLTPATPTSSVDITDSNAHFFSKKPLNDPSFQAIDPSLFTTLCQGAGISRPSRIQSLAWPAILKGGHTIVADQTGSGKTLAYLIPLLQKALSTPSTKQPGSPKILILAPTAELADQLNSVCRRISETVPFNTMVVTATGKLQTSIRDQIRRMQRTKIDVLISTPGRISTILRTRNSGLDLTTNLQTIVLDEVDILLVDETFGPQLRTVGEAAPLDKTQFVFVTATLPDQVVETVEKEFPGVQKIKGPGLHRVAPSVKERLVDVSVPSQFNRDKNYCFDVKAKELFKALRQNRCRRTLIFCNTVESCRDVENLLNRKDRRGRVFDVGSYHNAMTPEARNANLARFAKGKRDEKGNPVDYVLICTDRAARGVDFEQSPVDHVVIFDFPKDPAEYVRRVGRTARAGRTGTSTIFAYGWQLPIARSVMGSKLDSDNMAFTDENDEENYVQSRKQQRRSKDEVIKSNIENGRLWD